MMANIFMQGAEIKTHFIWGEGKRLKTLYPWGCDRKQTWAQTRGLPQLGRDHL